jgi:hypothetical protein
MMIGWICFRIFGPQAKTALPSDKKMRKRERLFLALGLILFFGGFPVGFYLGDLLQSFRFGFWPSFIFQMVPSFCGVAFMTWAMVMNLREYKPI